MEKKDFVLYVGGVLFARKPSASLCRLVFEEYRKRRNWFVTEPAVILYPDNREEEWSHEHLEWLRPTTAIERALREDLGNPYFRTLARMVQP